ncbi:MAG: tyrosine-type recombinase/integrase [Roseibium sp.]
MTSSHTKKIPLVLKFEDWPEGDRAAWEKLFRAGGVFDDEGAFSHWSDGSRKKREQSYGQWLSFLARTSPEQLELAPSTRVSRSNVKAYLDGCERRLAPKSVLNLISDLFVVTRSFDTLSDWTWLDHLTKRLKYKADKHALPPRAPITANEIFDWSFTRIKEVETWNDVSDLRRAIWFRQALMIGFLASRPVRRRSLLSMTVDRHLKAVEDGFTLTFYPEDMKNRQRYSWPLPYALAKPMQRYLLTYRPSLLKGKQSSYLWISQYGNPIRPDGFSRELPNLTLRHLGLELRPHRFREIAATSIAEFDPKHVGIIRDILGHATLDMAEKHYNRATGISSYNAYQGLIADVLSKNGRRQ